MSAAKGSRVPRFWDCTDSVMKIGCLQSDKTQIDMASAQEADVQLVRCSIGGGAMLMEYGDGITYFSLGRTWMLTMLGTNCIGQCLLIVACA